MAASDTSEVSLGDDCDGVFGDFVQETNLGLCTNQQSDIEVSDVSSVHPRDPDLSDPERFRESESESDELSDEDWSDTVNDHEIENSQSLLHQLLLYHRTRSLLTTFCSCSRRKCSSELLKKLICKHCRKALTT